jgi:hypothetical protein
VTEPIDRIPSVRRLFPLGAIALLWAMAAGAAPPSETPTVEIELEGGPVWQTRNDVQIPNDAAGTRFSLVDLAGEGPAAGARAYLTWHLGDRHALRALAAPLRFVESGTPVVPVDFAGERFVAGDPLEAAYRFNSWRLTYRYRLVRTERSCAWIGFTAKVRDAEIRLRQGATTANDTDVGFVPLLHLAGELDLSSRWRLLLDADALGGGPGRAIDAALKLGYELDPAWCVTLGYRTLEGGANVSSVYNFAWLHYAVVSVVWRR